MAVNVAGLVSVAIFYLIVMGTGFWASRKSKQEEARCTGTQSEIAMVGGRNLNIWVSIFTTTATYVGGGYILGSAEVVYTPNRGLVWLTGAFGIVLNLIIVGRFFVKPVRGKNYVTILDPFQEKYGNALPAILVIPYVVSGLFWMGSVLAGLGGTMSVILDISSHIAVVISAAVAILYTLMGGLYSVAYTDIIQLLFILIGLWSCVPFVILSPSSVAITNTSMTRIYQEPWVGTLQVQDLGIWLDELLLMVIGPLCFQEIYQRILATATVKQAQVTCYITAVSMIVLAIPSILIGAVAASTDWNQTTVGLPTPYEQGKAAIILPLVLQHLCPEFVSLVGIGALAAAVMSSIDSALLSAASLFTRNIYKTILRKNASEKEMLLVVKLSILVFGMIGAGLAMSTSSVYGLWLLSSDIMYTVVSCQLLAVLFLPRVTNGYGALAGLVTGMVLRGLAGEPSLGVEPVWTLPGDRLAEDGTLVQGFPYRTAIFLASLASVLLWSRLASWLFLRDWLPQSWDVFRVGQQEERERGRDAEGQSAGGDGERKRKRERGCDAEGQSAGGDGEREREAMKLRDRAGGD